MEAVAVIITDATDSKINTTMYAEKEFNYSERSAFVNNITTFD